ncbi:DUF1642 domain-containing protein [Enterococcus durans]|uniref:DUF1642 domain-containing protein n=1 Tax=Enterococcus durans TaxID=53345 RepID=UPI00280F96A7|nr:DUF1642 domain-containing protein [Enterococcus faecium]HBK5582598.1 DUF1642 domain-containing protein [Enterococcus faecium]
MNKQELINELKRISLEKQHKALTHPESKNYYEGMVMAYSQVVHMVNTVLKLDEPQKPVVPKFVAEWFEENKDDLEFAIWELCVDSYGSAEQGMLNWIQQSENNSIETLIRMKDGYEVEKEPLYRVKIGEGYFVEYQGRGALIMPDCNKEIKIFDSKSDAERTAQTIGGTVEEVVER